MSDEDASLAVHVVESVGSEAAAAATATTSTSTAIGRRSLATKCNSIIYNKRHEVPDNCATTGITIDPSSLTKQSVVFTDADPNECKQVDVTLTVPMTTTTTFVRRPNASPTVPSIAVTSVAADPTGTTVVPATKRACNKRTGKIDFVRFDSVETVYKQTDHDEVILRAAIKDEIKR